MLFDIGNIYLRNKYYYIRIFFCLDYNLDKLDIKLRV